MASFWARYQFPAGISVGAGVRYIGKQWADDANTARLPSVTLMDAMMRADLGVWSPTLKGAYVQVNANNIGDREYISGCYGTGNCYWGAERSVIATVGYDFEDVASGRLPEAKRGITWRPALSVVSRYSAAPAVPGVFSPHARRTHRRRDR